MEIKENSWIIRYASMVESVVEVDWVYVYNEQGDIQYDDDGWAIRKYAKTTNSCAIISGLIKSTFAILVGFAIAFLAAVILGDTLAFLAALITEGMIVFSVIDGPAFLGLVFLMIALLLCFGIAIAKLLNKGVDNFGESARTVSALISAKTDKICMKIDVKD